MPTEKSKPNNHQTPHQNLSDSLYRSDTNKVIAGVCGGLGEYLQIDPTIIRIIFLLITIFGGSGLLIYIVLWLIIPKKHNDHLSGQDHLKANVEEIKETAQSFANDIRFRRQQNSRQWIGLIIVVLGIAFLLSNFGLGDYFNFSKLWPLFLILIGVALFVRKG